MKQKSKTYSIAFATSFLILFLILVPSEAFAEPLTVTETRVTTTGSSTNADIYGNTVVWQDTRNGGSDIYAYNIPAKKEKRISYSGSAVNPAIYNNLIVWSDGRNGNGGDVYMYDLSAKKEIRVTKSGSAVNPDIYGKKIVYQNSGIFLYDLSTNKVTKIVEDYVPFDDGSDYPDEYRSFNTNPAIYGNRIAWLNEGSLSAAEPFDYIGIYDLSTKKNTVIGGGSYVDVSSPDIYNKRIVWHEWRYEESGESSYISMYDFSTKNENHVPVSFSSGLDPRIYGERIVFGNSIYDLSTNTETQITTSGSASYPAIYKDRIVWQDSRNGGSDIYLGILTYPLAADFSASPTSGKAPLTVKFRDTSTGSPTSWYWNFGDKYVSKVKNPVHKYTKPGNYTVTLTVKNAAGNNTVTKTDYITVQNPPAADFSAAPLYGKAPLTVNFTDNSTGSPTSWYWKFGDGSTSKLQNPVHNYTKAGKYTVCLRVSSAAGSSRVTKRSYITVISPPVAAFYASPISGKAPLTVSFKDRSTGVPNSWYWDFGDGSNSTLPSPSHTYKVGGYRKYYTVTLKVENEAGNNTVTKYNYITVR